MGEAERVAASLNPHTELPRKKKR